jgi:cobalt-zinc-cadmium efflux system outer membrane protein
VIRSLSIFLSAVAALFAAQPAHADLPPLTMDQAVAIALNRNHDAIAARLDIESAQLDRVQASLYPNPILSYAVGNLVLGQGNTQEGKVSPEFFDQTVHQIGVTEIIDVWAKRTARMHTADRSIEHRKLVVEDALREIAYAVRSAFAEVIREQSERELSIETRARYDETVRLSRARFKAGDISDSELKKVELEGMRYENGVIEADLQLDLAKQRLAALLGLPAGALPGEPMENQAPRVPYDRNALIDRALDMRPDVRAARQAKLLTEAVLAQARREAFPDIALGVAYTHSNFTISGDNPNTLALSLSLPLPTFDRNQANIGRAKVDIKRVENEGQRLVVLVQREVAESVSRASRSESMLKIFEGGGMLSRAETSLKVAERSYQAGASSLLELLEAQRTYLETRAQYLRASHDYRQATIDVAHAVGDPNGVR